MEFIYRLCPTSDWKQRGVQAITRRVAKDICIHTYNWNFFLVLTFMYSVLAIFAYILTWSMGTPGLVILCTSINSKL